MRGMREVSADLAVKDRSAAERDAGPDLFRVPQFPRHFSRRKIKITQQPTALTTHKLHNPSIYVRNTFWQIYEPGIYLLDDDPRSLCAWEPSSPAEDVLISSVSLTHLLACARSRESSTPGLIKTMRMRMS